jgi:CHAT domain-containing protein
MRAITDPRIGSGAVAPGRRKFAARLTGIQLGGTFQDLPRTFIEAKCLYELGRIREAEPKYRELLRNPHIQQFGGIYWIILFDLGLVSERAGDPGVAIDLLSKAIDVIESQRSSIDTEVGRIGFVGDKQAVYATLVRVLARAKRVVDAFEVVERAKGRALVDLLASRGTAKIELGTSGPTRALVRELDATEQSSTALVPTGTQRGLVRTRVSEIARTEPQLASLVAVQRVTAASIQQRLRTDETLVEYYATDASLYTFVATRSQLTVIVAPVGDLVKTVAAFRAAVADRTSQDHKQWSAKLHALLVEPVTKELATERLVIVPHGVLHYVPFAALEGAGKYLLDRHTIRILPSASVLLYLPDDSTRAIKKALVLGNPDVGDKKLDLPYAEDEARAILTTSSKELRVRDQAGEAFVKKHARDYDILHFAAHGVFDAQQPLASALLLARGDGDDGLLTVGELFGVAMPARLVTLSACDTALGDIKGADEVVGFTRALLYAGARTIVASLWKVDDLATRDLMVAFYAGVLSSDRETSLRRAQQATRDLHPHPYFWAGFQAYGDHL